MLLSVWGLAGCSPRVALVDTRESIPTRDGVALIGHAYVPTQSNPPGLVLVHGAGADRHRWERFAVRAQQWGYLAVTVDLRGHGESAVESGPYAHHRQFGDIEWQSAALDIDAALGRLQALGAAPEDLFLVGEGFGANLVLDYARTHRDVQGVVLLSAGKTYHGLEADVLMAELRTRPTLLLWSERDDYAAATGASLQRVAPGHMEVRVYPGTAFGADIFDGAPESIGQVLVWLDQMRAKPAQTTP